MIRCQERIGPYAEKPSGGLSLVVEADVVLPASPPALAFRGPLCVKCWRWLIFVLPPLWERKTQLIHGDLSLIPRGLSQSHSFLLSSLGFLLLRASLPGTTVTPDLKLPKDPGYLMLMSSLELSHSKMFPHKVRGDLLLPLCCQDFDRKSEPRHFFVHLHTFVLRFPKLNFWVSCFGRAAMSSVFPTRRSWGHLDRWRKYLTYWKYKDILKELGAGVQLQGFVGSVEASRVGVLRNWVGSIEHLILLTDILLPLWPHGCDGNGRCRIGSWFEKKKSILLAFQRL